MIAFLRSLILHDFWLKLLSAVLAILIWVTITFAQTGGGRSLLFNRNADEHTYYNIPVQVRVSAAEIRSFRVDPTDVAVKLRGDPDKLRNLRYDEIEAVVDLTGIESARGLRKRIKVTTPSVDIVVVQVVPDEVEVIVPPLR